MAPRKRRPVPVLVPATIWSAAREQIRYRVQVRPDLCKCFIIHCIFMPAVARVFYPFKWLGVAAWESRSLRVRLAPLGAPVRARAHPSAVEQRSNSSSNNSFRRIRVTIPAHEPASHRVHRQAAPVMEALAPVAEHARPPHWTAEG
jgi:hypothetical protein